MIKVKNTFHNGLFECEEIYSDIGMKILDKRDGEKYDNTYDDPIAVDKRRYDNGDYVETSEPIKPFEVAEQ